MRTLTPKFLFLFLCAFMLAASSFAQGTMTTKAPEDKSKRPSPPATVTGTAPGGVAYTIDYSRPSVKGRKIFGGLEQYGKVWRTGANEATTFEVKQPVKINGQALPAGKYALFTIPGEQEWTIIFNKTANQWGAFKYDQAQDALRVQVKPTKAPALVEQFTISSDKNGVVTMAWENSQVSFTVSK